jgi:hypothetical protein
LEIAPQSTLKWLALSAPLDIIVTRLDYYSHQVFVIQGTIALEPLLFRPQGLNQSMKRRGRADLVFMEVYVKLADTVLLAHTSLNLVL